MQTTPRAIRIPDELWDQALDATQRRGETISDVVRDALSAYVKAVGVLVLVLAALLGLTACGSSDPAPVVTKSLAAQQPAGEPVDEPAASPSASATPACWSSAASTWMDDYNAVITDSAAAVAVLDALPDAHYGCTAADVADLVRAHDLADRIRPEN